MGLILDTSALVAWEKQGDSEAAWQSPLLDTTVTMPAIVWAECLAGVRLADSVKRAATRRARLEAVRQAIGVQPFTAVMAEHYAAIYAELSAAGRLIPANDIAVAATARSLEYGVLIGPDDEKHFRAIPDLEVCLWPS